MIELSVRVSTPSVVIATVSWPIAGVAEGTVRLMFSESRKWIGQVEVVPGAVVSQGPPRPVSFQVVSVCDEVRPERWHGEVRFGGVAVLRTEPVEDHGSAARLAEMTLSSRVRALFEA
ncbi:hypothetical protein GCM10012276_18900 [Nocardioides deserti]|nr:hypothetical protein GCM10012276_18900 [Nocardioides deserti]